jgi:hypothetical protein
VQHLLIPKCQQKWKQIEILRLHVYYPIIVNYSYVCWIFPNNPLHLTRQAHTLVSMTLELAVWLVDQWRLDGIEDTLMLSTPWVILGFAPILSFFHHLWQLYALENRCSFKEVTRNLIEPRRTWQNHSGSAAIMKCEQYIKYFLL